MARRMAGAVGKQIRMGTEGDGAVSGDLKAHTCEDHGRVQKTSSKQTHSRGSGQEVSGHEIGGRAQGHSWGSFSPGKVESWQDQSKTVSKPVWIYEDPWGREGELWMAREETGTSCRLA